MLQDINTKNKDDESWGYFQDEIEVILHRKNRYDLYQSFFRGGNRFQKKLSGYKINSLVGGSKVKQWTQVIGMNYEDAINLIENTDKYLMVQVLKVGAMSTMDYKANRVKLFVNKKGIVERVSSG